MALIRCKHCGESVSDSAKVCPHCNNILHQGNRGKRNLILYLVIGILALAALGGVAYYYFEIQNKKAEAEAVEQAKAEKAARIANVTDSIYANFTTPDLIMANAKGFVHTMEFRNGRESYSSKDADLTIITFGKNGEIIDIMAPNASLYEPPHPTVFQRDSEGRITEIGVRSSLTNNDGSSYKMSSFYRPQYDSNGRVCAIVDECDNEGGRGGMYFGGHHILSGYESGKGYTNEKWTFADGMADNIVTTSFKDYEYDDQGNWIKRTGSRHTYATYFESTDVLLNQTIPITQTRVITYYDKSEIDFTPYINK